MDSYPHNLPDLLARLAAISEALEDRQQRHHGVRAGASENVELSVEQAEIKAMKQQQAALRRQILASDQWDQLTTDERVA